MERGFKFILVFLIVCILSQISYADITSCGNIAASDNVTQNLTCSGNALNITANNVILDCNGYTINWDSEGTGSDAIVGNSINNLTVKNCILIDINASGSAGYGFSFINANQTIVENNTIRTNGTSLNHAIVFDSNSYNNKINSNTIITKGSSNGNFGIYLTTNVNNNNITNNQLYTDGTSDNHGIRLQSGTNNNIISNNTINSGGTTTENFGIYFFTSAINNTIQNNNVNTRGTSLNRGVYLSGAYDTQITNNIINSTGSDAGILMSTGYRNNITNNTVLVSGLSGVFGVSSSSNDNGTIINNRITAVGTSGNVRGISIDSQRTIISNNSVNSTGTSGNYGLFFGLSATNGSILNNTFIVNGSSFINLGLYFSIGASSNNVTNNFIETSGTYGNDAIFLETTANNKFDYNVLQTTGNASFAIAANGSNSTFNNTYLNNTNGWINATTALINFTNTIFETLKGKINISSFSINSSAIINRENLNISQNRAFLNSSNISFMNTTAQITLNNVSSSTLLVDLEDDGTYSLCSSPQCLLQSYLSEVVVFNVSSFTSYSTSDFGGVNVTLSKSDSPDPLNLSNTTLLTYQINFTVTNGTAYNVTINETYPSNTTFVNATPSPTTGNNSWNAGNITTGNTYQINITLNVSNTLPNGTVLTNTVNTTYANSTGSTLTNNVQENTTILAPTGITCGAAISINTNLTGNLTCSGNGLNITANNVILDCNGHTLTGDGTGYGIYLVIVSNITVKNCIIKSFDKNIFFDRTTNSQAYNNTLSNSTQESLDLYLGSHNNSVYNTTINASGAGLRTYGNQTTIRDSTITAGTTALDLTGVKDTILERNTITSSTFYAVYDSAFTNTTLTNNSITSNGADSLVTNSNNSLIRGNNITSTTSSAITIYGHNSIFESNKINSTAGNGIYTAAGGNFTITYNTVNSSSNAIELNAGIGNSTVIGNNCSASGGGSGLDVASSNNTIRNNMAYSVTSNGIEIRGSYNNVSNNRGSSGNVGFYVETSNSYFYNNTGYSYDTYGLIIQGSYHNLFVNNTGIVDYNATLPYPSCAIGFAVGVGNNTFINTTATAPIARGMWFSDVFGNTQNNTFINTTIETNNTWIVLDANAVNNSFQRTTFKKTQGRITILENITLPESTNITVQKLNIGQNYSFINTTNLTFFNTSAEITLNGMNDSNPKIIADYNDNGTFTTCSSPECNIISYAGGVLTFNVSHFTTYSTASFEGVNVTLSKSDLPDPLNLSNTTLLTYQINFTVNNGTAYNTTINETYPSNTTFVNATPSPTTGNNSWNAGNISAGSTYQINITLNVSSSLNNGTILTNTVNATLENSTGGQFIINVTENTTIIKNQEFNTTIVTLTKTDSQDPILAGSQLNYTININVTSGTAINLTLTESYPPDATFDSATPSPTLGNTWSIGNITSGQTYQINITVNISGTASGTITNTVNITYQNSTNNTISAGVQENTTIITSSPASSGSGGGGGGGSSSAICPPFCRYPENANLPVCRNNCITKTPQISYPTFPITTNKVEQAEKTEIGQTIEEKVEKANQAEQEVKETKQEIQQAKYKLPDNLLYYVFFAMAGLGILTLLIIGAKHNKK